MTLKVAENWYERRKVDEDITLLWEPYRGATRPL